MAIPSRAPADENLVAAVAEGDRQAFRLLYDRHAPWLTLRLLRRCADACAARSGRCRAFGRARSIADSRANTPMASPGARNQLFGLDRMPTATLRVAGRCNDYRSNRPKRGVASAVR